MSSSSALPHFLSDTVSFSLYHSLFLPLLTSDLSLMFGMLPPNTGGGGGTDPPFIGGGGGGAPPKLGGGSGGAGILSDWGDL